MPPEPLILAFDTSAAHCAVALCQGTTVLAQASEEMTKGQAERLMPMIQETLAEADCSFADLAAIGCGIGPGNFTGIRISVSAARAFGFSLNIPAIGVSSLEALAHDLPRPCLALVDAKRDHVYAQGFGTEPEAPKRLAFEDLPELPSDIHIVGHRSGDLAGRHHDRTAPSASTIAAIAATRLGRAHPPPAPLYLRDADAALPSTAPPRILDET
ncbi:tRNA (adenosine(37)-N6)-threonylcarbamoyltransferase complex dimerization subunit type 1 TsaB [Algicella marina]|uniref:tRNA (Adenosine(37)-N6)-threonylcarbamoyltransferase complex dimerization subunit type 1 TsaB n=1 Tax=Algicella marina TaxID=2683284 RepID=A0A6P1T2I4_9RHOB|nr:tRNA (adenosine(37)-N6)-threonylcarbamoyltransferase complex dimerization subunit type 1 TsaB [Algicella marina]QHQ36000.1 tRNA (adenosine(37)-N6)-threonylcarbamoyltransferase complex dimerization subunit type 1 TsaB [Algicella marina]